jgi:hypothetical protein
MSINLQALVEKAFSIIRATVPDAILTGQFVKYTQQLNETTLQNEKVISAQQNVECVYESSTEFFRLAMNSASEEERIIVFGYLIQPVEFFDELVIGSNTYRTSRLKSYPIGSSDALHQVVVTK